METEKCMAGTDICRLLGLWICFLFKVIQKLPRYFLFIGCPYNWCFYTSNLENERQDII